MEIIEYIDYFSIDIKRKVINGTCINIRLFETKSDHKLFVVEEQIVGTLKTGLSGSIKVIESLKNI